MKKTFTTLCIAALAVIGLPSFGQVKLGVQVGLSANSVSYNLEDSKEEKEAKEVTKMRPGFTLGLAAEYGLTDALSLQTGLEIANKGYNQKNEEGDFSIEQKNSFTSLQIPVHVAYKFAGVQVHAGPYFGFNVAGKLKYDYNFGDEKESGEEKFKFKNKVSDSDDDSLEDDEDYMRRMDVGLNLGLGYQVGPVLVKGTYAKGLSNIFPSYEDDEDDEDDYKVSHKGFTLSATWFFN